MEELIQQEIAPKIYMSVPKKKIPVPEEPFEKWHKKFKTFREMMNEDEWNEVFSNYYSFEDHEKDIRIDEEVEDMNEYTQHQQIQEIIRCTNSFTYFCIKYAKVNHPIFGLINFIPYNYQRRVIECYDTHRFNILSKFRQGGLTTISVAWAVWRCMFKTGQRIMVVSKTDREAIAAGEVAKTILEHLPTWLQPLMDKCNEHEKQFKETSSVLWFYTVEAARGKAITILIIDEAAFIADMHKHWKALYPVISTGGSVEVISTVNGMGNWYYDIYTEAEGGKNPFNIVELDYWEHPKYNDPKWIKDTYEALGEKGWKQEIERSFLGSGDTWINSLVIKDIVEFTRDNLPIRQSFSKWKSQGTERRINWDEGALWIWREPIEDHEYIVGVDCAEGVGETGDNSCFQIIDQVTLEQVAEFYSNTIPPHIFAQIINEIGYFYNTALIVVENANQGVAVCSSLQHDLAYENLYYEDSKQNTPGIKQGKTKRALLLQALQQRLLNGTVKINSLRFANELNTFIFNPNTKKAEAQKGKHDDAILSMAICLYVRDAQLRNIPVGAEVPEEMMHIYRSEIYEEIKQEIMKDAPEKWLNDEDDDMLPLLIDRDENSVGFSFRRKYDALLREFGW